MKNSLILALIATFAYLQSSAQSSDSYEPAPGNYITERPSNENEHLREDIIWSEDFENGIPSDWIAEGEPAPATWEYRGPSTTPDVNIGTIGSCLPEGSPGGNPLISDTWDNGFIIFDSNYWDDDIGPCGSFGQGEAAAPHLATLQFGPVDFTGYDEVGMSFFQYMKNFEADTRVEYRLPGDGWEFLWSNDLANSEFTEPDDFVRFNVTDQVGGLPEVHFRFVFEGTYYFWMIDDIKFFELEQNNLVIKDPSYGDYDFDNPDYTTGFEFLEYSLYPEAMSPLLKFKTNAVNLGADDQNNCVLDIAVTNDVGTELHTATSEPDFISSDGIVELRAGVYDLDDGQGEFTVDYNITQEQEEDSPENNQMSRSFEVNDVIYARDRLETTGIYLPNPAFEETPYEMGNFFVVTEDGQDCHSVTVGVGLGSNPETPVYAAIYNVSFDTGIQSTLIATTSEIPLEAAAINDLEDNHYMVLNFDAPVALEKDSAYLVVCGVPSGPTDVVFSTSGDAPVFSSWVRFLPNNWFYMLKTPMIRMNFGPFVSVEEEFDTVSDLVNYPNPAGDLTTIQFSLASSSASRLVIRDQAGQIVQEEMLGTLASGEHKIEVNTSALSAGIYTYTLYSANRRDTQILVIGR